MGIWIKTNKTMRNYMHRRGLTMPLRRTFCVEKWANGAKKNKCVAHHTTNIQNKTTSQHAKRERQRKWERNLFNKKSEDSIRIVKVCNQEKKSNKKLLFLQKICVFVLFSWFFFSLFGEFKWNLRLKMKFPIFIVFKLLTIT